MRREEPLLTSAHQAPAVSVYAGSPIVSQVSLASPSDDMDISRVILSPMSLHSSWDEHICSPRCSFDPIGPVYDTEVCTPSDEEVHGIWPFPVDSAPVCVAERYCDTKSDDLFVARNIALPEDDDADLVLPVNVALPADNDHDFPSILPTHVPLPDDDDDFPTCPSPLLVEAPSSPRLHLDAPTPAFDRAYKFLSTHPYISNSDLGRVFLALTYPVHDTETTFPLYTLLLKHDQNPILSFLIRTYFLCANTLSLSYTSTIFPPSHLNGPGIWGGVLTLLRHDGYSHKLEGLWGEECSVFYQAAEITARNAFDLHFKRLGWVMYLWVAIRTSFFTPRLWEEPTSLDPIHHPVLRPMFPALFDKEWQMPAHLLRFNIVRDLTHTINYTRFNATVNVVHWRFRTLVRVVAGWAALTVFALFMYLFMQFM